MPTYLVIDTSGSLTGHIDLINRALANLLDAVRSHPAVADNLQIALIRFSSEAEEVLPLTDIDAIEALPALRAAGRTNYRAAFSLARQLIDRDTTKLRAAGLRVFRPLMFFVTDGMPTDGGWRKSLVDLQSPNFRAHPTIIAIGYGSADPGILREIGTGMSSAFLISDVISIGDAVSSLGAVLPSMVTSSVMASVASSDNEVAIPAVEIPAHWLDLSSIRGDVV